MKNPHNFFGFSSIYDATFIYHFFKVI